MPRHILVLYNNPYYPARVTVLDHLYCFERYSGDRCYYLNLAARPLPFYVRRMHFDLVVFHTVFLSTRWDEAAFDLLRRKVAWLKTLPVPKVALPQDEFLNTDALCRFLNDFKVDVVASVAPPSEWPKIYQGLSPSTRIIKVLTGYLDDGTLQRVAALARRRGTRPRRLDIGYRAWQAEAWLGRHGLLKVELARRVEPEAARRHLRTDISLNDRKSLMGDRWLSYLLDCRYTLGVEGGASLLDRDLSLLRATRQFVAQHPEATFAEIEAACFPGRDGELALFALSPRHLEACATRTCQILIEGSYDGVLQPGQHYLELKKDFSNLGPVLDEVQQGQQSARIVDQAWNDIVASGKYRYQELVRLVLEQAPPEQTPSRLPWFQAAAFHWMRLTDRVQGALLAVRWGWIATVRPRLVRPAKWLLRPLIKRPI